jgi:hypothetical protein
MMSTARQLTALGLLLALVMGGQLAPNVHRAQHASERVAEQAAAAQACTHEGHDAPVWHAGAAAWHAPDCALCTVRLVVTPDRSAHTPTPLRLAAAVPLSPSRALPAVATGHLPIRAPPHAA